MRFLSVRRSTSRLQAGFTALEAFIMLIILVLFTMVLIALVKYQRKSPQVTSESEAASAGVKPVQRSVDRPDPPEYESLVAPPPPRVPAAAPPVAPASPAAPPVDLPLAEPLPPKTPPVESPARNGGK